MSNEKTGLRERMGGAVNATNLLAVEDREGSVDLVGALALTQINPGAQSHAGEEIIEIDPRARLGALLVRIKAGRQYREGEIAVQLLVHWVRNRRPKFLKRRIGARRVQESSGLLHGFVRQALAEWLWPVCPTCRGAEWDGQQSCDVVTKRRLCPECRGGLTVLARTERGKLYRKACPRCSSLGIVMRDELRALRSKTCFPCHGTGVRLINDAERARALQVSLEIYARHWIRQFTWLHERLDKLDALENDFLHCARDRRISLGP